MRFSYILFCCSIYFLDLPPLLKAWVSPSQSALALTWSFAQVVGGGLYQSYRQKVPFLPFISCGGLSTRTERVVLFAGAVGTVAWYRSLKTRRLYLQNLLCQHANFIQDQTTARMFLVGDFHHLTVVSIDTNSALAMSISKSRRFLGNNLRAFSEIAI